MERKKQRQGQSSTRKILGKKSSKRNAKSSIEELYKQVNKINSAMWKDKSINVEFKKGFNVALNYIYQAMIEEKGGREKYEG
ncbi:hypothetical protein Z957_12335 [Clostridium sp. K25]|uniref:Uncharacterized protein n=1 Tax=Clostridium novyi B str. ATCC 27606 TaxID=1443123 RepID=A0AA40M6C4_CLONO|nr:MULTISPECIES: hypothetical protein [Clostridium]KEI10828.1 hypothetical protein Z957_12335 [Clostridium sp. K25]KEI17789.1 hypothetical protein Z959_05970 [Clostridium novyi B str. ATCC 27606]